MRFIEKIDLLCNEKGISVTRLAADLGLSSSTPNNWRSWEEGKLPRNSTLRAIADYFDVPFESLTGTDSPVSVQTVQDNHGIIGPTHAPVTIVNGSERPLSQQEVELLNIFGKLSVVDQAKLLVQASELLKGVEAK